MKVTIKVVTREGDGTNYVELIRAALQAKLDCYKATNPPGFMDAYEERFDSNIVEIASDLGMTAILTNGEYVFAKGGSQLWPKPSANL